MKETKIVFHLSCVDVSTGVADAGSHRLATTATAALVQLKELLTRYPSPQYGVRLFAPGAASDREWPALEDALGALYGVRVQ